MPEPTIQPPTLRREVCPNPACRDGRIPHMSMNGMFELWTDCPDCNGTGTVLTPITREEPTDE